MNKFIMILMMLVSQAAIAAIGTITEQVNKPPEIARAKGGAVTGSKGTGVEMNDTIKTGQGKVGITFEDETKVQVNENSKLVIDDFVYDAKSSKGGKLAVKVALGTVRYASGQIAKNSPQNVAINTPSATVSVRGTDFTATVDEVGASTVILLPSCPKIWVDIERDCKTGAIEVTTDAGFVLLNKPFQATKVESRNMVPMKPVILNLTEDAINNMLIVAPPKQLTREADDEKKRYGNKSALDVDFLKENGLVNQLELDEKTLYKDKLSQNLLDQNFLANILDIIDAQLAAQQNLLNTQKSGLLPDYVATSGVVASVDDLKVELCRNDGSNVQCVNTPKNQNTTITQQQGSVEIKNRVNNGGNTTITLRQN